MYSIENAREARRELSSYLDSNGVLFNKISLVPSGASWKILLELLNDEKIKIIPNTINNLNVEIVRIEKINDPAYENNHY